VPGRFLFKLEQMKANLRWLLNFAQFVLALLGIIIFLFPFNEIPANLVRPIPWWVCIFFFLGAGACRFYALKLSDEAEKQRALMHMADRPALNDPEFGKTFFPADRAEIAIKLREILAHHLPIDLSQIQPNDRFVEDLRMDALDSMSTVEYIIGIEKELAIKIPDSAAEKMQTFKDVVDYVAEAAKPTTVQVKL
jgi:acyl carrier protein